MGATLFHFPARTDGLQDFTGTRILGVENTYFRLAIEMAYLPHLGPSAWNGYFGSFGGQ